MSSSHENPARRDLDAYLDGTLPEHVRQRIAHEVGRDRELRGDVELQNRIDASLKRSFLPPAPPVDFLSQLRETAPSRTASPRRIGRRTFALSTATAAVGLAWGYLAWRYMPRRATHPNVPQPNPLETVYQQRVDSGFLPDLAIADDRALASTFYARQGQGLLLRPLDEGSHLVGLALCVGCGPATTAIMARVDNAPVMVFVDRLDADPKPQPPAQCVGLHMYRRELGSLVAYELSPLDQPRIMIRLYPAEVPR